MTGLVYNDRYHTYHLDGERLPSVTQILSVIRKPGLETWRGNIGNAEADRIAKDAGDHGTAVHAACEAIANGDTLLPYPPGVVEPAEAYYAWFNANVQEVLACETRLASVTHRYAGTVDLVVRLMTGDVAVIDLKTSSVVDPSFALQIEAYRQALLEQDGIEATRRLVIHMPRKTPGKLDVLEFPQDEALHDWRAFLSASIIWHRLFAAAAFAPRKPIVARAGVRG
jgi:hypothetical protein